VAVSAFTVGALANPVLIQNVSPFGGSTAPVPAPNFQVLGTAFILDSNTGNVTAINVNATTTGTSSSLSEFLVIIGVSCRKAGSEFHCATGQTNVILPGNMMAPSATGGGASTLITVPLNQQVNETANEIDNISVTAQAVPFRGPCIPSFFFGKALASSAQHLSINGQPVPPTPPIDLTYSTSVTATSSPNGSTQWIMEFSSLCGLSGTVTYSASSSIAGTIVNFNPTSPPGTSLLPGGTSFADETVTMPPSPPFGTDTVTTTACVGSTCQTVVQVYTIITLQ
jgi:hypothetical protein